jgi:mRNA interferase RelE/StbE
LAWTIRYDPRALKDLKKLDRTIQQEILDYMDNLVATAEGPRDFGKPLRASKFGLGRYRCGTTASSANGSRGNE